jgi:hypothetical protein
MTRLLGVVCVLAVAGLAQAADDKPNPTGTWTYTTDAGGQMLEVTIKLKLDGEKLTGTVTVADMEGAIEDAKYKDGEVSFKLIRDFGGMKITLKYKGTIKGDVFKGKREMERDGQTNSRDFEAKRAK